MGFDYAAKIQGLLANAEDEALSDAARSNYRAMAEKLMDKYRIAEEEALAVDPASSHPIKHDIMLREAHVGDTTFGYWYRSVFSSIAAHTGVRYVVRYLPHGMVATVVGYEGDVRYTEFLWTAAYVMFATRIDPVWNADLSDAENIFRLRNAGIERRKIADAAWNNGYDAAARSRVQRIYMRECERRNEPVRATGLGYQTSVYREAYARSFTHQLRRRLAEARDAADSVGGVLVLAGRTDRVDEAFYEAFPSYRPTPQPDVEDEDIEEEPCKACAKAKSGHCRQHPKVRWTATDEGRYQRMNHSASARAGTASGREAADGVVISRTGRASRIDRGDNAIEA
jgi:hypothetical protein